MILRSTAAILHKGFSMGNISLDCSNVGIRQNKGSGVNNSDSRV